MLANNSKRLQRRKYDPVIIERTCVCPSTALYISFLEHCTMTIRRWELYEVICPNLRAQRLKGPDSQPLLLFVGIPSALGSELTSRMAEHKLLWRISLCILIYYIFHPICLRYGFMASLLWLAVGPRSLKRGLFKNFKCVSVSLHSFCGKW